MQCAASILILRFSDNTDNVVYSLDRIIINVPGVTGYYSGEFGAFAFCRLDT